MRFHTHDPSMTYLQRVWFATVLAFAFILMSAMSAGCAPKHLSGDVPSMMDPAIAKLVKVVDGETAGYCTVFKVGTNLAMTAGHCCGLDADEIAVNEILGLTPVITYHAEGPHAVPGAAFEVVHDDDEHDVCVMKGKMGGAPIALANHDPAIGARVWTAGYPKTHMLFSDGLWSGREDGYAKASVAVWGGASGSPVMDGDGRVVGVLVAFYPPMANFSLIAPIEWLRAGMRVAQTQPALDLVR